MAEMLRDGVTVTLDSLKKDLEDRKRHQAKLLEAVETAPDVAVFTDRLRDLGAEIKSIEHAIAQYRPVKVDDSISDIRERVSKILSQLKATLEKASDGDLVQAKQTLAERLGKLVLTPTTRDGRPVYKVTGAFTLDGGDEKCRMQLVARDGIEPPTPAFSGL